MWEIGGVVAVAVVERVWAWELWLPREWELKQIREWDTFFIPKKGYSYTFFLSCSLVWEQAWGTNQYGRITGHGRQH